MSPLTMGSASKAREGGLPLQLVFDRTPEIFATDAAGSFQFPLQTEESHFLETSGFDEVRFVVSVWHPSENKSIDLDRAYVELRTCLDPQDEHWTRLAEIEPVVPPYNAGESFDGWIVLPVLARRTAYSIHGSGFAPRTRLQIRASAYFVS